MAFEQNNTYGERFGKDVDPQVAQAKSVEARKANKERREAVLSIIKAEPLPADVAAKSDAMLLNATQEELLALSVDPNAPVDIRRRARLLVGKDDELAIKVSETMRNRAFGKPAQSVVIGTGQTPPPPVYNIIYENEEQKDE